MESNKINVVLVKAAWCHYCNDFLPIYNKSSNIVNENKSLQNYNVAFETYDITIPSEEQNLKKKYPELLDKIDGYPFVFLQTVHDNKNKVSPIHHVVANHDDKLNEADEIKKSATEFVDNISNGYKTLTSDSKDLFTNMTGGGNKNLDRTTKNEALSRQKYIKYKTKYLELKSKF